MLGTYDTISTFGQSVALQKDGKLVVAGYSASNAVYSFTVSRYDADGSLDSTFGSGGTVRSLFLGGVSQDKSYSVGIQPDGKIVVAGVSQINGQGSAFALARYDTNGRPDTSFGNDGTVKTVVGGTGSNNSGFALSIQADCIGYNTEVGRPACSHDTLLLARQRSGHFRIERVFKSRFVHDRHGHRRG